jgi:hypothetical protein
MCFTTGSTAAVIGDGYFWPALLEPTTARRLPGIE